MPIEKPKSNKIKTIINRLTKKNNELKQIIECLKNDNSKLTDEYNKIYESENNYRQFSLFLYIFSLVFVFSFLSIFLYFFY